MDRVRRNIPVIISLVAPGLLLFFFAVFFPILKGAVYGMTDWRGIGKLEFIGFDNYIRVITQDKVFRTSLKNAGLLALFTIVVQHPIAVLFAILADKISGKLEAVFRAIFFIPCVISIVVISKMWISIYNSNFGLLNNLLDALRLGFLKQDWLGSPQVALYSVMFVIMWQGFGYAFLIYYAGIKGVPEELFEAAEIDGANNWQTFRYITLHILKPVILVNFVLAVVSSLKQMEAIFLMTGGGPGSTTQFIANYLYIQAFSAKKYGYANAISIVFVIICILISVLMQRALAPKEE